MRRVKHLHFVGIGGVGMGGIAEVLLTEGYVVSGSDAKESAVTKRLHSLGAKIMFQHHADNIRGAQVVVMSSAVNESNPEIMAARAQHIPVIARAEMLAELMRFRYGIAIAGTHGKTTTTSLIASVFAEGGVDPTFVIGGLLNSAGSNAKLGSGRYFVAEADESDASFLFLNPMMAVITNIEADHMETYQGDFARLEETFIQFIHKLPFYGLAVVCIDDPVIRRLLPRFGRPVTTYGFSADADWRASDFSQDGLTAHFTVTEKIQNETFSMSLNMAGRHNVLNALAAIAVAKEVGISTEAIQKALSEFAGIGRRFQIHGRYPYGNDHVTLIDDYGHHPSEIAATLDAVRLAWPDKRVVMAYQPHRYTRTRDLFDDFVKVLSTVDELLLLDIYPAGEAPIDGITGQALVDAICTGTQGKLSVHFIERTGHIDPYLKSALTGGDILLLQGAGDIGAIAHRLAEQSLKLETSRF